MDDLEQEVVADNSPSDDLRAALAESLAETPSVESTEAAPALEDAGAATWARGPDGKFIPKDGERQEVASPVQEKAPPAPAAASRVETSGEQTLPATPGAVEPPVHWSAPDKEKFAALPAEARAPFLDLYKRMEAGYSPKLQRAAQLERDFASAEHIFAPHAEALRTQNITPAHIIQQWAGIEQNLIAHRTAADAGQSGRGAEIVARIIKAYKVDPGEIAQLLTGERQPQPVAAIPPQLLETVSRLEQDALARREYDNRQRLTAAEQQMSSFANEKDDTGNIKHPFFSELEQDMAALAEIDRRAGRPLAISDLYDRAVYANPTTRGKLLALQKDTEAKQAAAVRKAQSEAARRASSSITGSPSGAAPTPRSNVNASVADDLRASMDELRA